VRPPNTKTVLETAVVLETSVNNVLVLIASGDLPAINTSKGKHRPRWAIPNESIDALGKIPTNPKPLANIPQHV